MAKRVDKATAPAAGDSPAADQLVALNPEVSLEIAGRNITIREYGFYEGLRVAHRAAGLIADLLKLSGGNDLRYVQVRRLFGVHEDVVVAIAAQAADVEPAWVRSLDDEQTEQFLSTWFTVNSPFFVQEVVVEAMEAHLAALPKSTGSGSSPGLPTPGSATSSNSSDTPSAS